MLADRWSEIEGLFTGSNTRLLRVVRAFAVSAEGPRAAGLGEQLLASTKPLAFPGEYDFLGASWPEMHAFLATHELSSTPPCEARSESPTEPAAPS